MENYKDFTHFLESVKLNELYDIKLELASMIILLNGNGQKINDAIDYAKSNSDFDFEKHNVLKSHISLITSEDKFLFENGELSNNFSKERLDEVFRLYPLMRKERNIVKDTEQYDVSNSSIDPKNIVIIAGVVVAAYLLYQILK